MRVTHTSSTTRASEAFLYQKNEAIVIPGVIVLNVWNMNGENKCQVKRSRGGGGGGWRARARRASSLRKHPIEQGWKAI